MPSPTPARADSELRDVNRRFYDALWTDARLIEPERFNTWPLVQSLLAPAQRRLEVAPGLRPRLPIEDTQFIDISAPALAKLCAQHRKAWGATLVDQPDRLRDEVVTVLTDLCLAGPTATGLVIHPAAARYRPQPHAAPPTRAARRLADQLELEMP